MNGSTATTEEGLADEIVASVRGCFFGTGVATNVATPGPCLARPSRLGDIFHSNAVLIRQPVAFINEPSYQRGRTRFQFGSTCLRISASSSRLRYGILS